ncbi:MAG: sigma-54-dependent Fis family transcriptional regulator [Ignavibacteriales bacterium]|nr:sigma-54-dependent Fis family transcriptional regulator [Ignavibacteriales bacterium]
MKSDKIFVIEDNETMRLGISESLKRDGYTIFAFDNGPDALKNYLVNPVPAAIIDLKMEPIDGIQILEELKKLNPKIEVIMISAYGTVETAVKAMQLGACDFLTKPFSNEELRLKVKKVFEKILNEQKIESLIEQNRILSEELYTGYDDMIGSSDAIKKVFGVIEQVADKGSVVLIQGESGTGKELAALAIHKKSRRVSEPFIKINCGALNENLLESELFGHEKGAFTGAIKNKKGRFELADKGTLFLDEIGDVSPAMQVKLLRVLQEGEFERVGGEETLKTDVRIICATNRDLHKLISEGKFREDLYYRLSVIPIDIPPLRKRKEDIVSLVEHFLKKTAEKNHMTCRRINKEGLKLLIEYPWPGNIREMENLMERLSVISIGEEIEAESVAQHLGQTKTFFNNNGNLPLEDAVYSYERNLIVEAMRKAGGVKNRAAKILGIGTSVLYYKLEKFGLL